MNFNQVPGDRPLPAAENRGIPAQFLLPKVTQDIIDRKFTAMYESFGITPEQVAAEDAETFKIVYAAINSRNPGISPDEGPIPGTLTFKDNPYAQLTRLPIPRPARFARLETYWDFPNNPETKSLQSMNAFPFKILSLEEERVKGKPIERWHLQLTPDAPPLLMHDADIRHVNNNRERGKPLFLQQAASEVMRTFGPEAVVALDHEAASEVIGLLQASEPYAMVADYGNVDQSGPPLYTA